MLTGRMIRALTLGAVAMAGAQAMPHGALAADPEVTLTIHHFLSPTSMGQTRMIEPWVERIEEASDGRIAFEIFPSLSMGGTRQDLHRQVREGEADIVWTAIGHTPGVFRHTEVFELPGVHLGSAVATNLAIDDTFELIAGDFDGIEPLLVHAHGGNALHLRRSMDDVMSLDVFEGLALHTPSPTGTRTIEALGAQAVDIPAIALPQALSDGRVEGMLAPFESLASSNLAEGTGTSIEGRGKLRFGTSVFVLGMNKERFDALPDDLRQVIENHTGREFAREMGDVWEAGETSGKRLQFDSGGTILRLNEDLTTDIAERGQTIVDRWIEDVSGQDLDGKALVDSARMAVRQNTD